MKVLRHYPLGDSAVTFKLGEEISIEVHQRVQALYKGVGQASWPEVQGVVPAYNSLTLYFCPLKGSYEQLVAKVKAIYQESMAIDVGIEVVGIDEFEADGLVFEGFDEAKGSAYKVIPVCYEEPFALDLERVASENKLSPQQIIELHSQSIYTVYMLGFSPGFPYLGGLAKELITPRLSAPRQEIPAGSVAIGGQQTGIYPYKSPGGWNVVGCTPLNMFDSWREKPSLLQPGDKVKFVPISTAEFELIRKGMADEKANRS